MGSSKRANPTHRKARATKAPSANNGRDTPNEDHPVDDYINTWESDYPEEPLNSQPEDMHTAPSRKGKEKMHEDSGKRLEKMHEVSGKGKEKMHKESGKGKDPAVVSKKGRPQMKHYKKGKL